PLIRRLLEAAHIPEILREAGPKGLHVNEISRRLTLDPSLLSHVLRLLATHHITREVRPDVFANDRISGAIDSGRTVTELGQTPETNYNGTNGIAAFVGLCTDELFKSAAHLTDCYLPSFAHVEHGNGGPPKSDSHSTENSVRGVASKNAQDGAVANSGMPKSDHI
ncbi:hypothetical protein WOLCODRAFT_83894, partial [Wolfiporia cocos MD-104 SS10]